VIDRALEATERVAWQQILLAQARMRPRWQLQDVYKLAFQAALGSEHAAPSESAARQWLEGEVAALGTDPREPKLEPISPHGQIARVNLRPYVAAGGSLDALLGAFLRTAATWQGNRETLRQYLQLAHDLMVRGELAFPPAEAGTCFGQLADQGFPPAHHTPVYREAYQPAYRVVLVAYLSPDSN